MKRDWRVIFPDTVMAGQAAMEADVTSVAG